jgi:diguanylate cyclase (GGDEF)-like protein
VVEVVGSTLGSASSAELVAGLASQLASSSSGIGFVYRCLDAVLEAWGVRDAMLILEEPPVGRQAFRARRRAPEGTWAAPLAVSGRRGLHTDPALADEDLGGIADLCQVALRLDLARYDALHDALTGLYNRRSFEDHLAQAVGRCRRYSWAFSLVFVDLDRFKALNDQFGHDAGDSVLRVVGDEMRRALRRGDVAARIGGDEFALLLPATETDFVPGLLERLRRDVRAATAGFDVGFSSGIASCPEEAEDVDDLTRLADKRLYEAKTA